MDKKLYVFDLDDTLIKSHTKIKLIHKKTKEINEFHTHEVSLIKNKNEYEFDYSDFANLELLKESDIIQSTYNHLLKIQKRYDVCVMTARGERDVVTSYLKYININLPDDLVYTVGDSLKGTMGNAPERKREAFVELIKRGYNKFYFYDDSIDNLNRVKTLEHDFDIRIKVIQINK